VENSSCLVGLWKVISGLLLDHEQPGSNPQVLINAVGSAGRCNTIQCVDSTMLPREKRSVWLCSVKT